jgi:hypothetical protein
MLALLGVLGPGCKGMLGCFCASHAMSVCADLRL